MLCFCEAMQSTHTGAEFEVDRPSVAQSLSTPGVVNETPYRSWPRLHVGTDGALAAPSDSVDIAQEPLVSLCQEEGAR